MAHARIDARFVAQHHDFLVRLARGLVGAGAADDTVQDAWLRALEAPPRRDARGYLATVLRHRALRVLRRERSRAGIERAGARDERLDEDIVRRIELAEELARALRLLPEAQRTTVYLRYYEGLSPAAIAARTGAPVATVKTRLTRGLAGLRAELEARQKDDDRPWLASLVALADEAAPRMAFGLGANAAIAAGALVAAACVLWLARPGWSGLLQPGASNVKPAALPATETALAAPPRMPLEFAHANEELRRPVPAAASMRAEPTQERDLAWQFGTARVSVRVVDENEVPLEGVELHATARVGDRDLVIAHGFEPPQLEAWAVTDERGEAAVELVAISSLTWDILATANGRGSLRLEVGSVAPASMVRLGTRTMQPGAAVDVRIVDDRGELFTGPVKVHAIVNENATGAARRFYAAKETSEGTLLFEDLPAGPLAIHVSAGYPIEVERPEFMVAPGRSYAVEITVFQETDVHAVTAVLRSRLGRRPEASEWVLRASDGSPLRIVDTDARRGIVRWRGATSGPLSLEFRADGYEPWSRDDVEPGESIFLTPTPTSCVRVKVVDREGEPVGVLGGVTVAASIPVGNHGAERREALHLHREPLAPSTELRLPPGDTTLVFSGPKWGEVTRVVSALGVDEKRDVDVVLTGLQEVTGQVVDVEGRPVPFARVQLLLPAEDADSERSPVLLLGSSTEGDVSRWRRELAFGFAERDGRFELGCAPGTDFIVRAWCADPAGATGRGAQRGWGSLTSFTARGLPTAALGAATLRALEGDAAQALELRLEGTTSVTGKIDTTPDRLGTFDLVLVPGREWPFNVEFFEAVEPGPAGEFRFHVVPGTYSLLARLGVQPYDDDTNGRAVRLVAEVEVPPEGLEDISVTPREPLPRRLPVELDCPGEPRGALVAAIASLGDDGSVDTRSRRYARAAADQPLSLPIETPGTWRVLLHDAEYQWALERDYVVDDDTESLQLSVHLARGALRAVDERGDPVADRALIPDLDFESAGFLRGDLARRTDADGRIEMVLPRGEVRLRTSFGFDPRTVTLPWPPPPGHRLVVPDQD